MAKVRAEREAARLKREAQEKRQEQERNAMKQHDKPCHQQEQDHEDNSNSNSNSNAGSIKRIASRRKSLNRPISAVKSTPQGMPRLRNT